MTTFLKNILIENENIIPICYGGKATEVNLPELFNDKKNIIFKPLDGLEN